MPIETRHTHCVLDCPDICSLEVELDDGRVTGIGAGPGNPDTAGFICDKVASFGKRLGHEDRLLYPLRRVGAKGEGRFERISWPVELGYSIRRVGIQLGPCGSVAA